MKKGPPKGTVPVNKGQKMDTPQCRCETFVATDPEHVKLGSKLYAKRARGYTSIFIYHEKRPDIPPKPLGYDQRGVAAWCLALAHLQRPEKHTVGSMS